MRKAIPLWTVLSLACLSCANTGGGGGSDTAASADSAGKTDTATGSDTGSKSDTGGKSDAGGGGDSTQGEEKSIVDIQKASVACPAADPQSWGEMPGVTIRNAVVTTPTKSEGSTGSLVGVYVQQKEGGLFSGLYAIGSKSSDLGQVKPGDVVTITGDVKDFYCFTEIYSKFTTIESAKGLPAALTVTTADIGDKVEAAKNEPYEGVLVELKDVVVGDEALGSDGKPHGDIYIGKDASDKALRMGSAFYGVYLSDKTKVDGKDVFTPKYPKGTKLGKVTGVLEYSFKTYRLVISKDPEGVVKP